MLEVDLQLLSGKKSLLCVSGGVDSMVLLDIVSSKSKELSIDFAVCHFEHGIRGKESELDMELVEKKCNELAVPFLCKRENIPELSGGSGIEEFARNRRYAFFYDCMRELDADYLVLAHHRDDNCETVLMNIIRGCGMSGLGGMKREQGRIFRPLLHIAKQELYEYAREAKIEYREDASNTDISYFRNSIRHELFPLLQERNPKIYEAIDRLRDIASLENDFFEKYISSLPWIIEKDYGYDIEVESFIKSHEAIRRRAVFHVLRLMSLKDYDYSLFTRIDSLCYKETGKKECAPLGVNIYKQNRVISFVKEENRQYHECRITNGNNKTCFGSFDCSELELEDIEPLKKDDLYTAYFSIDDSVALTVRQRRNGDKMKTFGGGTKKLKDILIDKKVPVFLRDRLPVVCIDDEIVWIPGVIRGAGYPADKGKTLKIIYNSC